MIFSVYAILHFLCMGGLPILWVNVTVYMTEIFTPNWRYSYQVAMQMPIKDLIFTAIIYYSRTWSQIHLWTGILAGCALPLFVLVPESARWLALNNRENEALQILIRISHKVESFGQKKYPSLPNSIGICSVP